jgi:hypothetical protein
MRRVLIFFVLYNLSQHEVISVNSNTLEKVTATVGSTVALKCPLINTEDGPVRNREYLKN